MFQHVLSPRKSTVHTISCAGLFACRKEGNCHGRASTLEKRGVSVKYMAPVCYMASCERGCYMRFDAWDLLVQDITDTEKRNTKLDRQ